MTVRSIVFLAGLSLAAVASAVPKSTSWTGAAGDWNWNNASNWSNGLPSKSELDTVVFGPDVTGGTITWATGGANRPKNSLFNFAAGAASFTLSASTTIDNTSGQITYTTDAGMNSDQTLAGVTVANFSVTMNGAGDLTFGSLTGNNSWDDANRNLLTANVNNADASLNIGDFAQNRGYDINKTGAGKLAITGTIDIVYNFKDTSPFAFLASGIRTTGASAGTIDLSTATANFEDHLEVGEGLVDGAKYTIVDYANATLIGNALTGFGSVVGVLPDGWGLRDNAVDKKIYLQQIPEPAAAVPLIGLVAFLKRRGRVGQ